MTDTEEAWYDENAMDWLTLLVVTTGVLVYLHDPSGAVRGALFAVFTVPGSLALYGSYKATIHTHD